MRDFDERDIWDVRESLSERLFRSTGARWQYWVSLGFTIGFTFVGLL